MPKRFQDSGYKSRKEYIVRIKTGVLLLTFIGLILLYPNAAHAQAVNNAQIHGTVLDSTGGVVPGANIQATHDATGKIQTTVTGSSGDYVLPNLAVGAYTIEVKATGFERYVQKGIVLQVGDNVNLDVTMKVGAVSQSVEVNAGATMVQTQDTSISEVIDQRKIDDLPLNGRLATQLVILAGAATNFVPNGGDLTGSKNYLTSVSISVAGGEANGVEYLLDGADHNDPFSNINLPLPPPDALQEFSVQTNGLSARYGVHPGATANFVTKSGTNAFHGTYLSSCATDSLMPACTARRRKILYAATSLAVWGAEQSRRTSFSFSADTRARACAPLLAPPPVMFPPLRRYRETSPRWSPTPAWRPRRQGNIANSRIPLVAAPRLVPRRNTPRLRPPRFPRPCSARRRSPMPNWFPPSTDSCGKIIYGIPTPQNEDQFLGRLDWTLNSKQSLYGRYFDSDLQAPPVYNPAGLGMLTTTSAGNWERVQAMVLGHTWSLSPTKINSAHLSWTRLRDNRGTDPGRAGCDVGSGSTLMGPSCPNWPPTSSMFRLATTSTRGVAPVRRPSLTATPYKRPTTLIGSTASTSLFLAVNGCAIN